MSPLRLIVLLLGTVLFIGLAGRALLHWYDFNVTSWWRSPWHNLNVGGALYSLHQIGWAYDVVPKNEKLQALLDVWPFKFVVESDHVHLQIL